MKIDAWRRRGEPRRHVCRRQTLAWSPTPRMQMVRPEARPAVCVICKNRPSLTERSNEPPPRRWYPRYHRWDPWCAIVMETRTRLTPSGECIALSSSLTPWKRSPIRPRGNVDINSSSSSSSSLCPFGVGHIVLSRHVRPARCYRNDVCIWSWVEEGQLRVEAKKMGEKVKVDVVAREHRATR